MVPGQKGRTESSVRSKRRFLLLLGLALVMVDQIVKILVKTNMAIGDHFNVLGSWFQILFIENKGMAFGMSFGGVFGKYLLTIFRIVLFCILCWWIDRLIVKGNGKFAPAAGQVPAQTPRVPSAVLVGLTMIAAGALGNVIDCLFYGRIFSESLPGVVAGLGSYAPFMQGRVVDMFYFPLWVWPDWMPLVGGDVFFEPVFNFADSCVTVGAAYLFIFQWKFFNS